MLHNVHQLVAQCLVFGADQVVILEGGVLLVLSSSFNNVVSQITVFKTKIKKCGSFFNRPHSLFSFAMESLFFIFYFPDSCVMGISISSETQPSTDIFGCLSRGPRVALEDSKNMNTKRRNVVLCVSNLWNYIM